MKVSMNKEFKKLFTLEDLERAKLVIKTEKEEDNYTAEKWAEYAGRKSLERKGHFILEVISAKAETAKNGRIWNEYGEDSGDMDVWIEALFVTDFGMMKLEAYLSDIWHIGEDDSCFRCMFIQYFKQVETI